MSAAGVALPADDSALPGASDLTDTERQRIRATIEHLDRSLPDVDSGSPRKMVYNLAETCDLLGVSFMTIFRWRKLGLLHPIGGLAHLKFSHNELTRFIAAQTAADRLLSRRKKSAGKGEVARHE